MHEQYEVLERRATRTVTILGYSVLLFLCCQFALFARLTWWESSWDVMEPVTWLTNVCETIIAGYIYYLFRNREYSNEDFRAFLINRRIRKLARRANFDLQQYESLQQELNNLERHLEYFPKV